MLDYRKYITNGLIAGINSFRKTQVDSLYAAEKSKTGLFELTCGAGKTLIQATLIKKSLIEIEKQDRKGVIVVASHRLLLNAQLAKEYSRFIPDVNVKNDDIIVRYFCGIGGVIDDKGNRIANDKHASFAALKNDIHKAKVSNKHIIIFTTTASQKYYEEDIIKLFSSMNKGIDLYIHDEAHKEMDEKMINEIQTISKKSYFFTATPGEYLIKTFGRPLVKYTYTQAIADNVVVPPVLYTATANGFKSSRKNARFSAESCCIRDSFNHLKEIEALNGNANPSLLVFLPSIESVDSASKALKNMNIDANIYSFASYKEVKDSSGVTYKYGDCKINENKVDDFGKKYTKIDLLNALRNDKKPKIILNAFMLTEGIDLPTINGVLILCGKSDASLYQAVMRGCRTSKNKKDFAIYVPVDFMEENYYLQVKDFLTRLIELSDACFDYGGHTKDEATGKTKDDDVRDQEQRIEEFKVKKLIEDISFNVAEDKRNWNYKIEKNNLYEQFIEDCKGKDDTGIAMIKNKYIFENFEMIVNNDMLKKFATFNF